MDTEVLRTLVYILGKTVESIPIYGDTQPRLELSLGDQLRTREALKELNSDLIKRRQHVKRENTELPQV